VAAIGVGHWLKSLISAAKGHGPHDLSRNEVEGDLTLLAAEESKTFGLLFLLD